MKAELLEIILNIKNEELVELQGVTPVDYNAVNTLKKEIEYLKALKVRYEIARILHLEDNEEYISKDFIGIENENLSSYHITRDDIDRCNRLISYLPSDQVDRYRLRKQLAVILAENTRDDYIDVEDIEMANPTLEYYGLNQDQIDRFNAIVDEVNALGIETTKKVDINREAVERVRDALSKLDTTDIDEYNRIKEENLEKINQLIEYIDDNTKETIFTDITNYELVKDLTEKYPEMNVLMNTVGVSNLLNYISNTDLEEEDYNNYLDLLANNINKLYEEEANKPEIESIINTIDDDNYILRDDLSAKVGNIENVHLNIENNELRSIINYLDENYGTLEESKRERYYKIVENKISSNASDLNQINEINDLLLHVRNRELNSRLSSKFANTGNIEVQDQHKGAYSSLVQTTIDKLNKQKSKYQSKQSRFVGMNIYYDTKIREIDKEIELLQHLEVDYDDKKSIDILDNRYNKKTDKVIEIEKKIKALQELKEQVNSKVYKKVIDRRISNKQNKINKLQKSKTKIVGVQKKIMAPRVWIEQQRGGVERHFDAKHETYEAYSQDLGRMAQAEREIGGMFSGIKAAFYEHKADHYQRVSERNEAICQILNGATVNARGNNRVVMNRNILDRIRQNQQPAVQVM